MDFVGLLGPSEDVSFNASKCIICQKTTNEKLSGTSHGRKRIRESSDIMNDCVTKRLKLAEGDNFAYHVNKNTSGCYKKYTNSTNLKNLIKATGRTGKYSRTSCFSKACFYTSVNCYESPFSQFWCNGNSCE